MNREQRRAEMKRRLRQLKKDSKLQLERLVFIEKRLAKKKAQEAKQ